MTISEIFSYAMPLVAGAVCYLLGHARGYNEGTVKLPPFGTRPPPRAPCDITINFSGSTEDRHKVRAAILDAIESVRKADPS